MIVTKKLSRFGRIVLSVAVLIAACEITFLTTYNVMNVRMKRAVAEAVESVAGSILPDAESESVDETLARMQEIVGAYFYGTPGEFSPEGAMDEVYRSYIASLGDDYAAYYSPEEFADYQDTVSGRMSGIGVQVHYQAEPERLTVLLVLPGSPAEEAGLMAGDSIVAVDGRRLSEVGYSATVNAISGEIGTTVELTLRRDGAEIVRSVRRDHYTNVTVFSSTCDGGRLGLIRITGFDGTTAEQFRTAVDSLTAKGIEGLVFDVRNNGGGSLDSVLSVLSYLVPEGEPLIHIHDREGKDEVLKSDDPHTVELPMVALTNGQTASAAELFTSCLRELRSAALVGEKTFGKGCMQRTFNLPNGGGMKLTYRMYNPPSDVSYHGVGIAPDIAATLSEQFRELPLMSLTESEDSQLQAAISACGKS